MLIVEHEFSFGAIHRDSSVGWFGWAYPTPVAKMTSHVKPSEVADRTLMLQGIYSWPQNGCADREPAALVIRDHLLSGARRILKPAANPPDRIAHGFCVQIE